MLNDSEEINKITWLTSILASDRNIFFLFQSSSAEHFAGQIPVKSLGWVEPNNPNKSFLIILEILVLRTREAGWKVKLFFFFLPDRV